jgi:hypothetical protein
MIYGELGEAKAAEWFKYTRSKFITHVDTFYYSVKIKGNSEDNPGYRSLISRLNVLREKAREGREPQPFMPDRLQNAEVQPYGVRMYIYSVSVADKFDIFFAEKTPNKETNEIMVQVRSQFIWLEGLEDAYMKSYAALWAILREYGVEIHCMHENRIDFAWHTNYIQDMLTFFDQKNLGKMAVHSFNRWNEEGVCRGDDLEVDYITLGRRKSNNAFFRAYNKSKEVIEMGYKQFFVPIWRQSGLISAFDEYIFDKVFEHGKNSWNYKEAARCMFYLEHGGDEEIKADIRQLLSYADTPVCHLKKLADKCVPDLTDVVNIEMETHRRFYYDLPLPEVERPNYIQPCEHRIYQILHMLPSIRRYITHDTIRFVKYKGKNGELRRERRPTADWWLRLSACGEYEGVQYDLCREYQNRYDLQRIKTRTLNSLASISSMLEGDSGGEVSLRKDWEDVLSHVNDNDIERYKRYRKGKRRELDRRLGESRPGKLYAGNLKREQEGVAAVIQYYGTDKVNCMICEKFVPFEEMAFLKNTRHGICRGCKHVLNGS